MSHPRPRIAFAALAQCLALAAHACSDEPPAEPVTTGSAGSSGDSGTPPADSGQDSGPGADAPVEGDSAPDAASDSPADAPPDPPPTAPVVEPEPLAAPDWVLASLYAAEPDGVYPLLEAGQFVLPAPGSYAGADWEAAKAGPHGELVDTGYPLIYAATKITVPAGRRVFTRADRVAGLYVANKELQPGDIYGSGRTRVPLDASGETLLVARAVGQRGAPAVELWTTPDELTLNLADATLPDLVEGESYEQWIGVPVLNATDRAAVGLRAMVVGSGAAKPTSVAHTALPPRAVTQVAFRLALEQAPAKAGDKITVRLRLEPPGFDHSYERDLELAAVARDAVRRRTRRSAVDGSVQYYAALPPSGFTPGTQYALILSLHGAGVEAGGQAGSYAPKSWAWVVAPTNRRPFGFDWEEWGRMDAIEALDHASDAYGIDPRRVYLTGHSMGGHGTWHVGAHFTHRFALVGPSAGWISFESYVGTPFKTGPVGRARAASRTLDFVPNLASRAVYILHGDADDNVPVTEAKAGFDAVSKVTTDVTMHLEPGAGHWWDDDPNTPGVACVDWAPMMTMMQARTRDPVELDFSLRTPAPWVSATRSFATIRSCVSPMKDCEVSSKSAGATVTLTTTNVRSLVLDGKALGSKGVTKAVVDGQGHTVAGDAPIPIGPQDGKTPDRSGPLNQAFARPFCFVYDASKPEAYRRHASWLSSVWAIIGNGQACALPIEQLTDSIRASSQIVYVGVASKSLPALEAMGVSWDGAAVHIGGKDLAGAVIWVAFPEQGRLSAAIAAPDGKEHLLRRYQPFSSRSGMPDWFVYDDAGLRASGFFDATWKLDAAYSEYVP
jgi:poly(3-hydroxybutyrate) depolymerase